MLHSQPMNNIVTNEQLNVESNTFLLQCLKLGETVFSHFNKYCLQEKTMTLLDTIPKTRTVKRSLTCIPLFAVKKETASFMRYINYARIRNYPVGTQHKMNVFCKFKIGPFVPREKGHL